MTFFEAFAPNSSMRFARMEVRKMLTNPHVPPM